MATTDSNGTRIGRGTRVMVRFADVGMEHQPLEWTGRVGSASRIPGRVRMQSEYVNWKPALHLVPQGEPGGALGYTVTRLADQSGPVEYHEHRENGRHVVRPLSTF